MYLFMFILTYVYIHIYVYIHVYVWNANVEVRVRTPPSLNPWSRLEAARLPDIYALAGPWLLRHTLGEDMVQHV